MESLKEKQIKQLQKVVCICKGIKLKSILKHLAQCDSTEEVNKKAGTGSGGCKGERCGPCIESLIKKQRENKKK